MILLANGILILHFQLGPSLRFGDLQWNRVSLRCWFAKGSSILLRRTSISARDECSTSHEGATVEVAPYYTLLDSVCHMFHEMAAGLLCSLDYVALAWLIGHFSCCTWCISWCIIHTSMAEWASYLLLLLGGSTTWMVLAACCTASCLDPWQQKTQHVFQPFCILQRVRLFQLPGCLEKTESPQKRSGPTLPMRIRMRSTSGDGWRARHPWVWCRWCGPLQCWAQSGTSLPFFGRYEFAIHLSSTWMICWRKGPVFLNISGNNTLDISDFFSWLNICWTFLYGKYPGKSELWPCGLPLRCLSVCKCSILIVAHLFPVRYIYVRLYLCQFLRLSNLQLIDVQLIVKLLMHTCSVITNIFIYFVPLFGYLKLLVFAIFPIKFHFLCFSRILSSEAMSLLGLGSLVMRRWVSHRTSPWPLSVRCSCALAIEKKTSQVINLCFWDVKMMCSS